MFPPFLITPIQQQKEYKVYRIVGSTVKADRATIFNHTNNRISIKVTIIKTAHLPGDSMIEYHTT